MKKIENIFAQTRENENFRQVLLTGDDVQVVIMSIPAGEEIGEEVHPDNDQLLLLVEGSGTAMVDEEESAFDEGDVVLVPAGSSHNFMADKDDDLKIITTYSPPHHADGTIHRTKEEADASEVDEDDDDGE